MNVVRRRYFECGQIELPRLEAAVRGACGKPRTGGTGSEAD